MQLFTSTTTQTLFVVIAAMQSNPIYANGDASQYTVDNNNFKTCSCEHGFETLTFEYHAELCYQEFYGNTKGCKPDKKDAAYSNKMPFVVDYKVKSGSMVFDNNPITLTEGDDIQKGNRLKNKIVVGGKFGCVPLFLDFYLKKYKTDDLVQELSIATNTCVHKKYFHLIEADDPDPTITEIGGLLIENLFMGALKFVDWTCRDKPLPAPPTLDSGHIGDKCTKFHMFCTENDDVEFDVAAIGTLYKKCSYLPTLSQGRQKIQCQSLTSTKDGEYSGIPIWQLCPETCAQVGIGQCSEIWSEINDGQNLRSF
eukprot:CAMPEP_0170978132 /NCGR_PEP_ID=MMETSP0736-20130129/1009_1 /TAXON_ID=186038 /ORGANISM="Fragilariopsis kerguelensis, Strain L26-C5" /LENGTH=310 /DNA_ID=CAMNT_0011400427 /DNA_START=50 /DNA_END=982 /DNA_ORIENTATION=+